MKRWIIQLIKIAINALNKNTTTKAIPNNSKYDLNLLKSRSE